ncbi:MAG: hypothetical protein U1A22_04090 [Xanthomonadaceae bacterium]|nr:hypothetical protein [Xanthomonadaceae bacterium]
MTFRLAAFVLGACFFLSNAAHAMVIAIPCHGCDDGQAQQLVRSKGAGTYYLYDFLNEVLRKYEVRIERDLVPGENTIFVVPLAVEPNYAAYFSTLVKVRNEFGSLARITVPIDLRPGDIGRNDIDLGRINAADLIRVGRNRSALFDFISRQQGVLLERSGLPAQTAVDLASLLQSPDKVFTSDELLQITIRLTFSGGSRITLTQTDSDIVVVPGTGIDTDGNQIPDSNSPRFAGEYRFGTDAARDSFVATASIWGIQFPAATDSRTLVCSWDGNTLSCSPT